MNGNKERLKEEIIAIGKRLYDTGIAVARSGNISCRMGADRVLITATGAFLGSLTPAHIVEVGLDGNAAAGENRPSSELPLHALVYKTFPCARIIHAHPPLTNGYFAVMDTLKPLTFETSFYLGSVPVIPQDTPTVTDPAPVVAALKTSNVVVLRNHGIVAVGESFSDALGLIETLEEAVRSVAVARLFNKQALDALEEPLKIVLEKKAVGFPMFSREHIEAIVELVNKDELIAVKGRELDLTVQLAIKLDGSPAAFRFSFEKGRIAQLEETGDAPFVISADRGVWESVFLGRIDPFVAVTQGKMKLQGQLGQLSKWYVPFARLFQLFKQVEFV